MVRTRSGRNHKRYSLGEFEMSARDLGQRRKFRRLQTKRGGGDHRRFRLGVQPSAQFTQFQGSGNFPCGQGLAVEEQRRAAGPEWLKQRCRVVEQRPAPVAFRGNPLDHPLLQAPDRKLRLGLEETFQRCDPGRNSFSQQLAHRPNLELHETRLIVMAGYEAPKLAIDYERGHEGRAHAHIFQILDVNGRHAAQRAHRHVEILAGDRRKSRSQGHRFVGDIDQNAHPVAHIQAPRHLRDIGRRIAVAEKRLQLWFTFL